MINRNQKVFSVGILVLLTILFVSLTILSSVFLKGMRFDLTANNLYTLNDGTLSILENMDEPVDLQLYFSEDVSRELPQFRSYSRWAGEMLEEFVEASDGKLTLRRVDPVPPGHDRGDLPGRRCAVGKGRQRQHRGTETDKQSSVKHLNCLPSTFAG